MALIAILIGGAYLAAKSGIAHTPFNQFPGRVAPTTPSQTPPMNIYNPAANDIIRVKATTYDPLRIGETVRTKTNNFKGDYRLEKYIGPEAASRSNALHRRQSIQDMFVQQQGAYILDEQRLDPVYWKTGVKPHARINSNGDPGYKRVAPLTYSPYKIKN